MYKELEKYRTGIKVPATIGSNLKLDEYTAQYGDLINDFIAHKNKPFWRRKYYHSHLTEIYLEMLNKFSITHLL
jgi:hypothetical protein